MHALIAHRPAGWQGLVELLGGSECAWADVDGWHEDVCPAEEPPGATHLWAWSGTSAFLVRWTPQRMVCAELRSDVSAAPADGEMVDVVRHEAEVWPDGQNGISVPSLRRRYELLGADGVWFVRPL